HGRVVFNEAARFGGGEHWFHPSNDEPPRRPTPLGLPLLHDDGQVQVYDLGEDWVVEDNPEHGLWVRPASLPDGVSAPRPELPDGAAPHQPPPRPRVTINIPGAAAPVPALVSKRLPALVKHVNTALPGGVTADVLNHTPPQTAEQAPPEPR